MHRTRSKMAAWMIGVTVILAGMLAAATPSLSQSPQKAASVLTGPDPPATGAHPISSTTEASSKPLTDASSVPLKGNTHFGVGPNRRSSNFIIIQRADPLRPADAWNLGPELRLPITTTTETLTVDELTDGLMTVAFSFSSQWFAARASRSGYRGPMLRTELTKP